MKLLLIGLPAFLFLAATPSFARTWSGFLVGTECYEAEERNVNPRDTEVYVDRDKDSEVRYCSPNAKTKSFSIVDHDGMGFRLDADGSAKAAEIVRQTGKKYFLEVSVTGEMSKNTIKVDTISLVQ